MRWLLVGLLLSCKRDAPVVAVEASTPDIPDVAPVAIVDTGVPKPSVELESKRVLERWDAAYNAHNANGVASQYGPSVRYYGATLTREACQEKIAAYIAKNPDQIQSSALESVTVVPDGIRVRFTKTLTTAGKAKRYPSYFHLQKSMAGGLRIDEESDPVTDKNLSIGTCEDALAALSRDRTTAFEVTSAPEVSKSGDTWSVVRFYKGGLLEIDYDPKTNTFVEGMGKEDMRPLTEAQNRRDAVKAKCK